MTATYTYPDESAPPPARTSTRSTVSYDQFVQSYARLSAWYGLMSFGGIALIVGAGLYLDGNAMLITIAIGFGIAGGGAIGLWAAMAAHATYSRIMALTTVTTYQQAAAAAPSPRAFIASTNGGGHTIAVGAHWLTDDVWRKLVDAAGKDARITRDRSMRALSRRLYRSWSDTLGELERVGLVDGDGIITPAGMMAYTDGLPTHPAAAMSQNGTPSAHAPRTHEAIP